MSYRERKSVILENHNSDMQLACHGYSDTKDSLKVGKAYSVDVEVHSGHTRYYIGDHYYNSVCFGDIEAEIYSDMYNALEKIASGKSCEGELCQDHDCACDMKLAKAAFKKARGEKC